jgi:hypothetical protein
MRKLVIRGAFLSNRVFYMSAEDFNTCFEIPKGKEVSFFQLLC